MTTAFAWLGCCGFVAVAVWLVLITWDAYQERQTLRRTQEQWALQDAGRREAGIQVVMTSHWFSEDASAQAAVRCVGEVLRDNGRLDADRAREAWRNAMKEG